MTYINETTISIEWEKILEPAKGGFYQSFTVDATIVLGASLPRPYPQWFVDRRNWALGQLGKVYLNKLDPRFHNIIVKGWVFNVEKILFTGHEYADIHLKPGKKLTRSGPQSRISEAHRVGGIFDVHGLAAVAGCPAIVIDRARSDHTWVQFHLPNGQPRQQIQIPGGVRNKYVLPKCNRVVWSDHVYRCGSGNKWVRVSGDARADILCHGGTPSSPYIVTGEN